jgi:hypothetical protein
MSPGPKLVDWRKQARKVRYLDENRRQGRLSGIRPEFILARPVG